MNTLLSISQFAKLCNTSKDTLIHYDEIGLFHPYQIGDNHYRLYSVSQCQLFHIIRFFTEQNLPLPEIKAIIESNSTDTLLQCMAQKRNDLLRQKQYLEGAILHLDDLLQLHSISSTDRFSDPVMISQTFPQDFFTTAVSHPCTTPKQFSQSLEEHFLGCYQNGLYPFPLTYILKKESLTARNYTPYLIGSPIGSAHINNHTYRKPEINYVVISHSGSYDTIHYSVEKALDYIKQKHLNILGNFYISDFSHCIPSDSSTLYILQIAVEKC